MGQEEDPKVPEHTSVTFQEPLRGPESSLSEKFLLPPGSPPPEPSPNCCHKQTVLLRRVPRTHLLAAHIAVLIFNVVFLVVPLTVSKANQRSDERGQTAGSAAEELKDGEVLPSCDEDWIWYKHKCFYFSEGGGNWTEAKDSCAALNSSLVLIDTQKELDFLLRYKGDPDHWIGLWRDSEKRWRWINDTEFNNCIGGTTT